MWPRARRAEDWMAPAGALVLIFTWPTLPLQDLPGWYLQAQLFQDLLQGQLPSPYRFIGTVPPNALTTVGLASLGSVVGMDAASRLWVAGAALGLLAAAKRLITTGGDCPLAARAPLLFVFSYPLLHGNMNSVLGLALCLWFATPLYRHCDSGTACGAGLAVGAPLLLYATHGIAYGMWVLFIATMPLVGRARVRLVAGLLPSLLVALHYLWSRPGGAAHLIGWGYDSPLDWLRYKFDTLYKQLAPLPAFDPFVTDDWAFWPIAAINYTVAVLLTGWSIKRLLVCWRQVGAVGSVRCKRVAATALLAGVLVAPKGLLGLVNPGERLVLPFVLLALALRLPRGSAGPRATAPARSFASWMGRHAMVISVLAMCQVMWIGVQGYRAQQPLAAIRQATTHAGEHLSLIHESHFKDGSISPRPALLRRMAALPRHYPLLRAALYDVHARSISVPIFTTGLFREPASRPPAQLLPSIEQARKNTASSILAVGYPERLMSIGAALPTHSVVFARPFCMLLKPTQMAEPPTSG